MTALATRKRQSSGSRCFLCDPEPELTWRASSNFVAVLGLGPIGEGYTLIAAREHIPSMLDLDDELATELTLFTSEVRELLEQVYGPAAIGEHGRVAPCVAPATRRHEPHCLHAHRLVFPGHASLDLRRAVGPMPIRSFSSYLDARRRFDWPGQYLYAEQPDGTCQVATVSGPLPRQLLRALVAAEQGRPELADWRRFADYERLEPARAALALVA